MYTQVDPTSIVFDFANTKIKINTPAESEWMQNAMFANGLTQEPVFEVGDVVQNKLAKKPGQYTYTIKSIEGGRVHYEDGATDQYALMANNYNIISKAKQQEIIGYELLKDLPGVKAGTKSNVISGNNVGFAKEYNQGSNLVLDLKQVSDTAWFRPIYKPTATVVEISGGRKVTIVGDKASLGKEFINVNQLSLLYEKITPIIPTGSGTYNLEVLTFRLGCQEFTKEDIVAVRNAFIK